MGVVYKARHIALKRIVALKMILSGAYAQTTELARFRFEAETIARLQHPNIVQIHEVGDVAGQPFCALEFVAGGSLATKLRATPQSPMEAARLVETLARAMDEAHQRGVVHRDLKPANILLTSEGVPKVTDFGLAKRLDEASGQTQSGILLGTPSYMAPEQASGAAAAVGPAADVYALGGILYETLTGRPPFRGANMLDTLEQVRSVDPAPPSRLQPKVPRDLETIALKCLQKEPHKRYASAGSLADDLARFLVGEPIVARPVSIGERVLKWVQRRPALAGLLVSSAVALLAVSAVLVGSAYNKELREARQAEEHERQRAEAALDTAETYLYFNRVGLAQRDWGDNNVKCTRALLEACPLSRRRWEWYYLDRHAHLEMLVMPCANDELTSVSWSPNGKYVASAGSARKVHVWSASSGEELLSLSHPGPVLLTSVAFSPDSNLLGATGGAGGEKGALVVWKLEEGDNKQSLEASPQFTVPDLSGDNAEVRFSPDSKTVAVCSGHVIGETGRVTFFDTATGKKRVTFESNQEGIQSCAFSPDGRRVVIAGGSSYANLTGKRQPGVLQIIDATTGKELQAPLSGHADAIFSVAWSSDGKHFASGGIDKDIRLWDARTCELVRALRGHTACVWSVVFQPPDGRQLASVGEDGVVRVWDVATGEERNVLRGHTSDVYDVAYNKDGTRLVSAGPDGSLRIWDADTMSGARVLGGHTSGVAAVIFAPVGDVLATGSQDRLVKIWDLRGRELRVLGPHDEGVSAVAFSPDGKQLAVATGDWQKIDEKGEVRVWEVSTGKELFRLRAHIGVARTVAFSPDGKRLATGGGEYLAPGEVILWDLASQRAEVTLPHARGVARLAFSPDGKQLAVLTNNNGEAKLWDLATQQELYTVRHGPVNNPIRLYALSVSPDGKRLATGGTDQIVKVWDLASGKHLLDLSGHRSDVISVDFNADGTRIVTGSWDQTVRVWDTATGHEVLMVKGHIAPVWEVAFSANGRFIGSASDDMTARLWDGTPRSEQRGSEGK